MSILIILLPFLLAGSSALEVGKIYGTFNTTVNLPCHKPCNGIVKWIKARPLPHQIAVCTNGSCTVNTSLEKRVTPMLSGNISLLLQQVVLADEGWYEGHCDVTVICDVTLNLSAHQSTIEVRVGVPLIISLLSSEPVRVTFRKSGLSDSADKLVCIVEGAVPFCVREYSTRASVQSHTVEFADVTQSDVGIFTVTHSKTKRILNTVNVTVKEEEDKGDGQEKVNDDTSTSINTVTDSCWVFTSCNIVLAVVASILGFFLRLPFGHFIAFVRRRYVKLSSRLQKKRKRRPTSESVREWKEKDGSSYSTVTMNLVTPSTP